MFYCVFMALASLPRSRLAASLVNQRSFLCGPTKDFTWITPVRQILVLVPRFDREFVTTFQRHDLSAAKMAPDLNSTLFSTKACVSTNELLREWVAQEGSRRTAHHLSWNMVRHVSVCLSFEQILARFSKSSHQIMLYMYVNQRLRCTAQNGIWKLLEATKTPQNTPGKFVQILL